MSEREPYSEWYWTWVDHRWLAPIRWCWDEIIRPYPLLLTYAAVVLYVLAR